MNNESNQCSSRGYAYVPADSVMVDIETHGSDPRRHPILQIGAVVFDTEFRIHSEFDACLSMPEDRKPSSETVQWWQETDPDLYRELCDRAETHDVVLERFAAWLQSWPHLWAWPAYFDLTFIRSYAKDYQIAGLEKKMHPYRWIDCRSWIAGVRRDLITDQEIETLTREPPPFPGRIHDGLYDARWQVICLKRVADLIAERELDNKPSHDM
jgi:3'-5' exoribonuclease Rv2179c-like domain